MRKIYFYPHRYLRDRQIDFIKSSTGFDVCNASLVIDRLGDQVSEKIANNPKLGVSWKQKIPLLNIKKRPKNAPGDSTIYVWGGLIATGPFIVDLDNPWSLVAYNVPAMKIYKWIIRKILLSDRCVEIRCLSEACRLSLLEIFGKRVYKKSSVHYPLSGIYSPSKITTSREKCCRFLFIGTQFELKGGAATLDAFEKARLKTPNIKLDMITHLPIQYVARVSSIPGITIHQPRYSRKEIFEKFMKNSDVLLHPSYMESFGMTILEAIGHGMVVIANDIYAIGEMVKSGENGFLLEPPITKWNGVLPNDLFSQTNEYICKIRNLNLVTYTDKLSSFMVELAGNFKLLEKMKKNSLLTFEKLENF